MKAELNLEPAVAEVKVEPVRWGDNRPSHR